jgi:UDP-N-acetylmuramate--alanine ligase
MYQTDYHIHFVGIGGIGMSGIAELLINLGYTVSGSDLKLSPITRRLADKGAAIFKGHSKKQVTDANVIVTSTAISSENPEVVRAKELGIPIIPRAEMLAELMRIKYAIAVSGAHGKTSTTAMIAQILNTAGLDPTVIIGGLLMGLDTNALHGKGDFIVAEADESDGSFLKYAPAIAAVTNIDLEHLDYYKDIEDIKDKFVQFINSVPFYGVAILCLDNEHVQNILPRITVRYTTFRPGGPGRPAGKGYPFQRRHQPVHREPPQPGPGHHCSQPGRPAQHFQCPGRHCRRPGVEDPL